MMSKRKIESGSDGNSRQRKRLDGYVIDRTSNSDLQIERMLEKVALPLALRNPAACLRPVEGAKTGDSLPDDIRERFKAILGEQLVEFVPPPEGARDLPPLPSLRVGCVLSGGQAPGGHNVIAGLFDHVARRGGVLLGFLGGPKGVMTGEHVVVTAQLVARYRGSGGFDMLGSGRDKIESPEQFAKAVATARTLKLTGLVVIGGDDSNTNAALLAEHFAQENVGCSVCGVPKTIDGDLKNEFIPISFGFDTACKTYAEQAGTLMLDCLTSQKYWHFVRLMGREASNITLEVALQTRPNVCLIGEEIRARSLSLLQLASEVCDVVCARAAAGRGYGVCVLPEGLIDFIPEFNALIAEINDAVASGPSTEEAVAVRLTPGARVSFEALPPSIRHELLLERDPHGNVQVAKIETEKLLALTMERELGRRAAAGSYSGRFRPQYHQFGYEGRCALPSPFDASYCYALGATAGMLVEKGRTGLIVSVGNLAQPVEQWSCGGAPIAHMCRMEKRKGKWKPVIAKALVDLAGRPFLAFSSQRAVWAERDCYRCVGPLQFAGPLSGAVTHTLMLEMAGDDAAAAAAYPPPPPAVPVDAGDGGTFLFAPRPASFRDGLEADRLSYTPLVPRAIAGVSEAAGGVSPTEHAELVESDAARPLVANDEAVIQRLFPKLASRLVEIVPRRRTPGTRQGDLRVGVCYFGRQAAGAHDLICSLASAVGTQGACVGFIGGVDGLCSGRCVTLTPEVLEGYRHQGGAELLGRSRDALTRDDIARVRATCTQQRLDGLVLLGGVRTATHGARLAQALSGPGDRPTAVVVCPVSIDGDVEHPLVEASVGFDTVSKGFATLVGNTAIDGASARKYWYFMRVKGATAGHLALETALQAHPNHLLLAEDVIARRLGIADVVREIADVVALRAAEGKNFGTVIVAEGVATAIPELRLLISECDRICKGAATAGILGTAFSSHCEATLHTQLSPWSLALYNALPHFAQRQLLRERQSDGAFDVSVLETERVLAHLVNQELTHRQEQGHYVGKFAEVCSYLGYQSRSALPSNFDCAYACTLGVAAAVLVAHKCSGVMASVAGLARAVEDWRVVGVPLTALMTVEEGKGGTPNARIIPSPVALDGAAYRNWAAIRKACASGELYRNPGPVQFYGDTQDRTTATLAAEAAAGHSARGYLESLELNASLLKDLQRTTRPGCPTKLLHAATNSLHALVELICVDQGCD